MHDRAVKWFEFEVHKRENRQNVKVPAESYKDALNKIQRIHPNCMVSLVKQWTQMEHLKPPPTARRRAVPPPPPERPEQTHNSRETDKQHNNSTISPYWEVLGVAKDASITEIKKAYVQRLKEYHPDRVADMGPELKKLAERKTFEILEAFNDAQKALRNS